MKKVAFICLFIFPFFCFSQKIFEGKITYAAPLLMNDSVLMVHYFSPRKIRIEMGFSKDDLSKDDNPVIGLLDSNIYYLLYPANKTAIRVIIDTSDDVEIIASDSLTEWLDICGFRCYGIKDSIKESASLIDSSISLSIKVTSWYAKDLYFPYKISRYFSSSSMVHNNNICLSSEADFHDLEFGDDEMNLIATKVDFVKNPDSLFQIPSAYSVQTIKMSEMFQKTSTVTIEDIIQEEKEEPEPPPPPPPKKPTKKTKGIKPVKG
jgi:hypothetical protein